MSEKNIHENSEQEFLKNKAKRKNRRQSNGNSGSSKPPKRMRALKIIGIILLALILLVVGACTYFKQIYRPSSEGNGGELGDAGIATELVDGETGEKISMAAGKYTFLATGCDKSEGLTDVIMVATLDLKGKKASIMSIPRDTYVKVSSKLIIDDNGAISKDNFSGSSAANEIKINAAYGRGRGFAATELERLVKEASGKSDAEISTLCKDSFLNIDAKTLKGYISETDKTKKNQMYDDIRKKFGIKYLSMLIYYNFGVPIDFYAQVNISGFRSIVDAIGGVDVVIQQDMDYDDPTQDLHIHLKAGPAHLDGEKAEQFVRFRYGYVSADLARIDAQKIFMTAFIKKLFSFSSVTKISAIAEEIQKNLTTNVTVSDAAFFATNALELDMSNISMLTLPGASQYRNNVSYYSANKAAVIEAVNTYLNKYDKPLSENSFCLTEITDKAVQSTGVLTADDISTNEPDLAFVGKGSSKKSSSSSSASSGSGSSASSASSGTSAQGASEQSAAQSETTTPESGKSEESGGAQNPQDIEEAPQTSSENAPSEENAQNQNAELSENSASEESSENNGGALTEEAPQNDGVQENSASDGVSRSAPELTDNDAASQVSDSEAEAAANDSAE